MMITIKTKTNQKGIKQNGNRETLQHKRSSGNTQGIRKKRIQIHGAGKT